jgi:endonuclease III
MKNGPLYAKRVKRLFHQLKRTEGKPVIGEPTDPTDQLVLSLLSVDSTEEQGAKALRKLREAAVDYNEIRVSSPAEVAGIVKDTIPDGARRARVLVQALNSVFRAGNQMSLAVLHDVGLREARQYLEQLDGVDPYTVASVMLWSLGGHAIPVSDRMLELFRGNDLVDPECGVAEVQSFLERHISAADAKQFCLLIRKYVAQRLRKRSGRDAARRSGDAKPATTSPKARRTAKKSDPRPATSPKRKTKTRSRR